MDEVIKLFLSLDKAARWDCVSMLVKLTNWTPPSVNLSLEKVNELRTLWEPVRTSCLMRDADLANSADEILGSDDVTPRQAGLVRAAISCGKKS